MGEFVLNEKELNIYCKEFCLKTWGESFSIPIQISGRLTRAYGLFYYVESGKKRKPLRIVISKRLLLKANDYKMETILSVIKHELCHYHLFRNNMEHRDHTSTFDNEALKIGATLTNTIRPSGNLVVGYCSKCGKISVYDAQPRHLQRPNRYITRCCKASIEYKQEYREDKTKVEYSKCDLEILNIIGKGNNNQKKQNKPECIIMKIEDIVVPGKRGVTRTQVHPAVEKYVDEKSPEKLKLIKKHYPDYFNQVCMYISKKRLSYIKKIGLA